MYNSNGCQRMGRVEDQQEASAETSADARSIPV